MTTRFVTTARHAGQQRHARRAQRVERGGQHLHAGVGDEADRVQRERGGGVLGVEGVEAPALEEQPHDRACAARSGPTVAGMRQEGDRGEAARQSVSRRPSMSPSAARAREAGRGDRPHRHPEDADGQVEDAERVLQPRRPRRPRATRRSCSRRCSPAPRPGRRWPGAISAADGADAGIARRPFRPEAPALLPQRRHLDQELRGAAEHGADRPADRRPAPGRSPSPTARPPSRW